jgi:type III secretion protein T
MQGMPAWLDQLLLVAVASARFGFAFLIVPLFATDTIPALVRNSLIVVFGGIAFALVPDGLGRDAGAFARTAMLLREAGIGVAIGFFFGTILWAMEGAGQIIDAKVGSTIGQLLDPNGGMMTSLNGALLQRLSHVLFAAGGGLTLLVGTIMESFAILPIGSGLPNLRAANLALFEQEFGRLIALSLLFASPTLVMLYVVDAALGLLNRFAQQLNVFSLALSIKSWAATALLLAVAPLLANAVVHELSTRADMVRAVLRLLAR